MPATTPLRDLLAEGGVLRHAYHETKPVLLPRAVETDGLPTAADLDALVEASLIRWPYFTVLQDGVTPPPEQTRSSRRVGGTAVADFFRSETVRAQLEAGATLKLSHVEDWHRTVREQVEELRRLFPVEAKAFLFLTPAGKRGMLPHRDGSRVVVIQIEGAKEWHLYHSGGDGHPDPGLDVDTADEVAVHLLQPGDVLYLPHGYGHAATAVEGTSLHLTFTLIEPTPKALLDAVIGAWTGSPGTARLLRDHRGLSPARKAEAVLEELRAFLATAEAEPVVRRALAAAAHREEA